MCGSLGERGLQGDGGTVASHDLNPLEFAHLRVFLCLIPFGTSLCHNPRAYSEGVPNFTQAIRSSESLPIREELQ